MSEGSAPQPGSPPTERSVSQPGSPPTERSASEQGSPPTEPDFGVNAGRSTDDGILLGTDPLEEPDEDDLKEGPEDDVELASDETSDDASIAENTTEVPPDARTEDVPPEAGYAAPANDPPDRPGRRQKEGV